MSFHVNSFFETIHMKCQVLLSGEKLKQIKISSVNICFSKIIIFLQTIGLGNLCESSRRDAQRDDSHVCKVLLSEMKKIKMSSADI